MTDARQKRGRWTLIALALLFIGPLAVSWVLYQGGIWRPGAGSNHGDLIEPVVTLPRTPLPTVDGGTTGGGFLYGKWTLVHILGDACDARCRDIVLKTRQVRLALGEEIDRIDRVAFLTGANAGDLGAGRQGLLLVVPAGDAGDAVMGVLNANGGAERIFLVDPLGNLILSYPRDAPRTDIRDDLKRLLRLSRIG